jgi:hypothetical protein
MLKVFVIAGGILTAAALFGMVLVIFVVPGWNNYERFLSVNHFAPQLAFVPVPAMLLRKSQVEQPIYLSTAVSIEYDYRLSRTISSAELQSYYNAQLEPLGWVFDETNIAPVPGLSADITVSYHRQVSTTTCWFMRFTITMASMVVSVS